MDWKTPYYTGTFLKNIDNLYESPIYDCDSIVDTVYIDDKGENHTKSGKLLSEYDLKVVKMFLSNVVGFLTLKVNVEDLTITQLEVLSNLAICSGINNEKQYVFNFRDDTKSDYIVWVVNTIFKKSQDIVTIVFE